ncbi:helix-turn-helix domain-containing protein [Paenactinomyces guangxiensis]|uniref:Tetratricopeptide repeat protein n=1 Tax=Paenactinomyces guangxiensis TaxID=1490290 RepID=A0A7W1WSH4_9BACL|nr:helix-turn-helix domain-containing protein [Paenactinomyces guangxiensis]MBA4495011.1 tetratricopeptide repeat protein [Paenactinomyces guangxiensis]MBH8592094.1 tetratricopeptide repeat protein [Paenactinomyces guangxiensis]
MDFKKVGELIRKVRKDRGMTLDDLCDDYIPRTTLSMIERGLTHNPVKVRYILRKLDINLTDLSKKEKEQAEDQELELIILENRINSEPRKTLSELSKFPAEYNRPVVDFLKGRCYYKTGQYDRAADFFNKALRVLEKSVDHERTNLKPLCLNHLSVIEFNQGNNEKALHYVEDGINSFDLNGERQYYYINLLTNKAIYLRGLGRAEKALKTLEEIKVNSFDINIDAVIGIYDLQAKLKREIKLYDEAASCAIKGLELARVNYNYPRQLELYITLGEIYRESGKLHQAEKCLNAGIALKDKISRRQFLIQDAYLKLGIVYFEKKDFQLSHKTLRKALNIVKIENDMLKYSKALLYVAKCFLSECKYEKALSTFKNVYELDSDDKTNLEALRGLSQASLLLGDETNYIKYSKLYFGTGI